MSLDRSLFGVHTLEIRSWFEVSSHDQNVKVLSNLGQCDVMSTTERS